MTTSPSLDPSPGLEVLGYRLVRRLGKGGFGEVWLATGPGGFDVAVKFVRHKTGAEKAERRSLQILRVVRHLNLLTVFAAAEVHDHLVIVMELANGSLLDRLRECQRQGQAGLPIDELLRYMTHAADGIDYLNAPQHTIDVKTNVSILHRDIKPHNLLLVGSSVKVADFGLARLQDSAAAEHSGSMTLAYAPPEFFRNQTTSRSDQFSLAATYFQLRTSKLPFGESMQEILARHLHVKDGPDLEGIPDGEQMAIAKALSHDPEDRYPSCGAFILALRDAIDGKAPDTIPITRPNGAPDGSTSKHLRPDPTLPLPDPTGTGKPDGRKRFTITKMLAIAGAFATVVLLTVLSLTLWKGPAARPTDPEPPAIPAFTGTLRGHTDNVVVVVFRPDGKQILSGGDDFKMMLWDAEDGRHLRTLDAHAGTVLGAAWSPDGKQFVSAGRDSLVKIWDAETGTLKRTLEGHTDVVWGADWSSDGKHVVSSSSDKTVRLWNAETGQLLRTLTGHIGNVGAVAFSPDGKQIVSGGQEGAPIVWDTETGREIRTLPGPRNWIKTIAWSPDGKYIACDSAENTVKIWNARTGAEVRTLVGHQGFVIGVAWSPDGKRIVSSGQDGNVILWDVATGALLRTIRGHTKWVFGVAWSPDGKRLASGGGDTTLKIWDADPEP